MSKFPEEPLNLTAADGAGYYPAYPGLKLRNGRYEVVRKLGWGPTKSVWMVTDAMEPTEYFALVILTAHETLKGTQKEKSIIASERYLTGVYDTFTLTNHRDGVSDEINDCFIVLLVAESCDALRRSSPTGCLPTHVGQLIIASTVEDLLRLEQNGILYGAVSPKSICFLLSQEIEHVERDLEQFDCPPCVIERWQTVEGVAYPIVRSHPLPSGCEWDVSPDDIYWTAVRLRAFGHVQPLSTSEKPPTWEGARIPRELLPPEAILDLPYTAKVEVWQLGCTAFNLLFGEPFVPKDMTADDATLLGWIIAMCGPVPHEMIEQSCIHERFFDESGAPWRSSLVGPFLEDRIREKGVTPEEDMEGVLWFFRACFAIDPRQRISTDELGVAKWLGKARNAWT